MADKRDNTLPDYRIILGVGLLLLLIYLLLPIMGPFLAAAIFAYICNPFVDRLSEIRLGRWNLGRTAATLIVMMFLVLIIAILLLVVVPMLQKELGMVIDKVPRYVDNVRSITDPWLLEHFGVTLNIDSLQVKEMFVSNWRSLTNSASKLLVVISTHGKAFINWVINLLLIPVVLFYLLRDWPSMLNRISRLIPRGRYVTVIGISKEIDDVLAQFLRGQLSVMVLMGIFYAVCLSLAGLELAIPIGLIAGLVGFVPYLGPATGILLALFAAILQFNHFSDLIPIALIFAVGQAIESMILTPWLVGDRIGLHPVIVIFALLAGGELFGFSGLLLALPVSAAIAVMAKYGKKAYLDSEFYQKRN